MPSPTYTALAEITLSSSASSVTFSSIPGTYRDLVLILNGRTSSPGADTVGIRFNSDTGSNYSNVRMVGTGSTATSASGTTAYGWISIVTNNSNPFLSITSLMDYTATDKHKTFLSRGNEDNGWVTAFAGRWANTAAITSLTILPPTGSTWTFESGFTAALYGIAS